MKKSIYLFLYLTICLNSIYAQDTLTFQNCLDLAFEHNLSLKVAVLQEEESVINYKRSKSNLYPNLNANISNNYAYGRSIDPYSNTFIDTQFKSYSGSLSSNILLFNGLRRSNAVKITKSEIDLQQSSIEKIKDDITIELASLYTTILYTIELIKSNKEQIEFSEKQKAFLKIKFDEGLITESEIFKIETQIASEHVNLITSENVLQMKYLDLKQIINISNTKIVQLQDLNSIELNQNDISSYLLDVEEIYKGNPSFLIAKIQEKNSKLNIKISEGGYLPTLNFQLNYGSFYSDSNSSLKFSEQWNNNKNYGFSFSLAIPIFNAFVIHNDVKRAKVEYKQSLVRTDIEKNRLIKVLSQANNDLVASKEKLKSASSAFLYAKKSFESDKLKYEYGKISLTELILTKKNYFNSQVELIKAKYEYVYNFGVIGFYKHNTFIF